jgi:hypothetical protein
VHEWEFRRAARGVSALGFSVLCAIALDAAWADTVGAQMSGEPYALKYFLDEPPTAADLARLPADARDVIVGKVRLLDKPFYLIEREQRSPLPKDRWSARLELLEVIAGDVQPGAQTDVRYGVPGQRATSPITPPVLEQRYFIASYLDQDGVRRLLGFPITPEAFKEHSDELMRQLRERDRRRRK